MIVFNERRVRDGEIERERKERKREKERDRQIEREIEREREIGRDIRGLKATFKLSQQFFENTLRNQENIQNNK